MDSTSFVFAVVAVCVCVFAVLVWAAWERKKEERKLPSATSQSSPLQRWTCILQSSSGRELGRQERDFDVLPQSIQKPHGKNPPDVFLLHHTKGATAFYVLQEQKPSAKSA